MKLAAGLAIGYVLGARAGREKFEQIAAGARNFSQHPAVQKVLAGGQEPAAAPAPAMPARQPRRAPGRARTAPSPNPVAPAAGDPIS